MDIHATIPHVVGIHTTLIPLDIYQILYKYHDFQFGQEDTW